MASPDSLYSTTQPCDVREGHGDVNSTRTALASLVWMANVVQCVYSGSWGLAAVARLGQGVLLALNYDGPAACDCYSCQLAALLAASGSS